MRLLLFCVLISGAAALFFGGGGGGGCCCGCGTPQPPSCGCGGQSVCPPPQACPSCAAPVCPPPPQAICPQVQPIYIPSSSCSGGSCGGGCSGGSCGGGGYLGGGYSASPGGGYASSSGYGGGVASGGGGYASQPLPAPASGFASSGGSNSGFAAPVSSGGNEAGYSQGTGGGYQEHVAAAVQADDPKGALNSIENGPVPPGNLPNLSQAFRNPQICEPKIKYVVIRAKKVPGRPGDEMEEEAEEVDRPSSLEATASPLDPKEISDELLHGEDELGDADGGIQARGATTLSDAKCNSKPLRDLIMENIVRDDALASKRQIHEASIKRFPEYTVDVICSTTGFTYLVSTTEHCESQRDNVICFVYKRPI